MLCQVSMNDVSLLLHCFKHVCCTSYYSTIRHINCVDVIMPHSKSRRLPYVFSCHIEDNYVNYLLHDLPGCQINKLQRMQNIAARCVLVHCHRRELTYHTIVLMKLHWLPVNSHETTHSVLNPATGISCTAWTGISCTAWTGTTLYH